MSVATPSAADIEDAGGYETPAVHHGAPAARGNGVSKAVFRPVESSPGAPSWAMHHGDAFEILRGFANDSVDVCITDPPYSERQHAVVRSSGRQRMADGNGVVGGCNVRRMVDLGFDHFTRDHCIHLALALSRIVKRWSIVFCDDNLLPVWWEAARFAGLQVVRNMTWVRIGGAPQFTGDRPAVGTEHMVLMHRRGRKRWNGGGKAGVYEHPIVANRSGHRTDRVHTTQKPEALMIDLVRDFSEPGETVLDAFAGSGTTGVAALRLGRSFVGCEKDSVYYDTARERLAAEERGSSLHASRAGQVALFAAGAGGGIEVNDACVG